MQGLSFASSVGGGTCDNVAVVFMKGWVELVLICDDGFCVSGGWKFM